VSFLASVFTGREHERHFGYLCSPAVDTARGYRLWTRVVCRPTELMHALMRDFVAFIALYRSEDVATYLFRTRFRHLEHRGRQETQLSLRDRATRACQLKSGKVLHKCRRLVFEKL